MYEHHVTRGATWSTDRSWHLDREGVADKR